MPSSAEGLFIAMLAVVPGFVATMLWARANTWRGLPNDLRLVLQSLALSLIVHAMASPFTIWWLYPHRGQLAEFPERLAVWVLVVGVVLPAAGGVVARPVSGYLAARGSEELTGWRRRVASVWPASVAPSIWDWLFLEGIPDGQFVLVEFNDGRRVAGAFEAGSFALTSPEPHGIYLRTEWLVDESGDITTPVADTEGIMIRDMTEVRFVRLLRGGEP
jgi:hypothetical protein